ncbi:sodium/glutamate symporter [Cetobacterium somerae]|uniref:sodium/glutamate symporter n=1 Tax=Cetobacterium sp. NK01 TaxID=2993530 RepID=UPI002115EFC1|nr:sodium/glutamate symporter [Cetobacterium sp. NK01]MCQ8213068.1 sodium/glutamate symporter [Cetobacterium sp. NK01]
MFTHTFNMAETLAIAVCLLLIGRWIKNKVYFFEKFFIPAPVIGGVIFSIISLIGYNMQLFVFDFDGSLKNLLMVAFFTTIGFLASLKMLKKGGVQVFTFLLVAVILVIIQNVVGVSLAKVFSLNPLIGIAAGSVPLTGGHGTSGAFGPVLEAAGATGAMSVAIASATFGLVAGCLIGGPVGKRLMAKHNLNSPREVEMFLDGNENPSETKLLLNEDLLFKGIVYIVLAMGIGGFITPLAKNLGIVLPIYIGPMIVAAIIRNIADGTKMEIPLNAINVVGNIALQLFLAMALMSMRLWELAALAVPLVAILLAQKIVMALYAYFVTFRVMGKDYDAAVMAVGHCGFGMGATPNAMANMESFTAANGPSPTAFFALPLVGSLFIDFVNASIITVFVNMFS